MSVRVRVPLLPASTRWAGVVAVAAAILLLSIVEPPAGGLPSAGPLGLVGADKWLHAADYAVLAAALAYALLDDGPPTAGLLVAAAGIAVAYGIGIEVLQSTLPARRFELADVGANALGAGIVSALWWLVRPWIRIGPAAGE